MNLKSFRHWRGVNFVYASLSDIFNKCYIKVVFLKKKTKFILVYKIWLGGVNVFTCLRVVDFVYMWMVRGEVTFCFEHLILMGVGAEKSGRGRCFWDQGGRYIVWRGGKFCFMPHWHTFDFFFRHWWRGLKNFSCLSVRHF